jgi:GNAT superfamily N-acetyltransferase
MRFDLTDAPAAADLDALSGHLGAYNDGDVGPMNRRPLAVFVRGDNGAMLAGLSGHTGWNWLFTQWLWVSKDLRGQGMALRMLEMAETEAVVRGCHSAWIDTFNPVALRAYQRAGYAVFGELAEFIPGRTRSFLQKRLEHV